MDMLNKDVLSYLVKMLDISALESLYLVNKYFHILCRDVLTDKYRQRYIEANFHNTRKWSHMQFHVVPSSKLNQQEQIETIRQFLSKYLAKELIAGNGLDERIYVTMDIKCMHSYEWYEYQTEYLNGVIWTIFDANKPLRDVLFIFFDHKLILAPVAHRHYRAALMQYIYNY